MCILCVASRWSRRIVTMLPWLIIPLIILWALSQLLPPTFRFEVTSPRLACVGVLLISLGWYELAMPRLSTWRARRSALLRERRRIEAQEAAKWRKEATRRCRNCLSAYRDQTPGGGKFMCTFCGHISKRPVLETPDGGVVPPGGSLGVGGGGGGAGGGNMQLANHNGTAAGSPGGFLGSRSSRGWGGRGWPERGGWVSGGRGWARSKGWGPGGGWGSGSASGAGGGPWNPSNWAGGSSSSGTSSSYWGRGTPVGAGWGGSGYGYGGGLFGIGSSEGCMANDAQQWGIFSIPFHSISFFLFCLKWAWRRIWRREGCGDDGGSIGGRGRGGQKKGEDGGIISQGSRGDKARRKAEEKRQARLEREQLEAEEMRQREEVARLVQERRRLRDEKLVAEKETEREAAAERERELRREREAERRRHEKVKEREKDSAKEKVMEKDSEDSKQKKDRKDAVVGDKRNENVEKHRGERDKKGSSPVQQHGDPTKKPTKGTSRGVLGGGVDAMVGHKGTDTGLKAAGSPAAVKPPGSSSTRYLGSPAAKGPSSGPAKGVGVAHQNSNASSFWSKGFATGGKARKGFPAGSPLNGTATHNNSSSSTLEVPPSKHTESSGSTWNRMPWNKVWGKSMSDGSSSSKVAPLPGAAGGFLNGRTISDTAATTAQTGVKQASALNGLSGSGVSDLSRPPAVDEVQKSSPEPSQPRSWHRLFSTSNSDVAVTHAPPSPNIDPRQQQPQPQLQHSEKASIISPSPSAPPVSPQETKSLFAETESMKFLGHGLSMGSSVPKPTAVTPAGPPPLTFTSLSPSSSSTITTGTTVSGFMPLQQQQHPAMLGATSTTSSAPPVPTPIGKPIQMPAAHLPVSSPLHMPAPLQLSIPITNQAQNQNLKQSQSQSHSHSRVPQDQLPQMLEPWGQPLNPPLAPDNSAERSVGEKWQMWDSPQLDQTQLSSIAEPMSNWNYSTGNGFLDNQQQQQAKDTTTTTTIARGQQQQSMSPEPVNPLPACLFSPNPALAPVCGNDNLFGGLPGGLNYSQSLWSDHSAFESAMRIWDDSDTHQRAPREFVDCITQEVMKDPVITADGHSYERAAIEQWLKTHDTSPRTGEVLPAPPGGYGSGIDKTLRPNHSLRGQIIEYRENMARLNRGSTMAENYTETRWSGGLGLGNSAWSTETPLIAGFYGTPGNQSVWSFNGSQNAQVPVLPEL